MTMYDQARETLHAHGADDLLDALGLQGHWGYNSDAHRDKGHRRIKVWVDPIDDKPARDELVPDFARPRRTRVTGSRIA